MTSRIAFISFNTSVTFFSLVDLLSLFQSFNCDSERPHTEMVLIKSGKHNLTTYSYQMVLGCFTAQQEKGPPFFQFFFKEHVNISGKTNVLLNKINTSAMSKKTPEHQENMEHYH